jgi:hypothetical protein
MEPRRPADGKLIVFLTAIFLMSAGGAAVAEEELSRSQTVYVPVYSRQWRRRDHPQDRG